MKCCFRICTNDAVWTKGTITTFHGGKIHYIATKDGAPTREVFQLNNTEIIFCGYYMTLTGYVKNDNEQTYRVVSVDVVGGWTVPKGNI